MCVAELVDEAHPERICESLVISQTNNSEGNMLGTRKVVPDSQLWDFYVQSCCVYNKHLHHHFKFPLKHFHCLLTDLLSSLTNW